MMNRIKTAVTAVTESLRRYVTGLRRDLDLALHGEDTYCDGCKRFSRTFYCPYC